MASSKPVKVLLAGDVGGALPALMKRVEAVNSKNGPFDLLVCVGGFFPPGGTQLAAIETRLCTRARAARRCSV